MSKTTIAGIAMGVDEVLRFAQILECKFDRWSMKYLSLTLGGVPRSLSFWDPVIEKFQGKMLEEGLHLCGLKNHSYQSNTIQPTGLLHVIV